jgi:hypothetical protein
MRPPTRQHAMPVDDMSVEMPVGMAVGISVGMSVEFQEAAPGA